MMLHGSGEKSSLAADALKATHDLAAVAPKIIDHSLAPQILREFGLEEILNSDFAIDIAKALGGPRAEVAMTDFTHSLYRMSTRWEHMVFSVGPLEKLTIPAAITKEHDYDDILTLEFHTQKEDKPEVSRIERLLDSSTKLYSAVARATVKGDIDTLKLVYLTSGSGFRFDLKGLGEPIKRTKELLVEAWEKIRHRKSDDFHHNIKAVVKGLDVLAKIGAHKNLDPETRSRLEHDITDSMFKLFETGALPREVKTVEVVSNTRLIESFHQNLLPAPAKQLSTSSRAKKSAKKAAKGKQ